MICYRDMTFCPFYVECYDGKTCPRALTEEVAEAADKCGLLISMFAEPPDCLLDKD